MTFGTKALSPSELVFCRHSISADAFAAIAIHHLVVGQTMTCVRASDGERALISHAVHGAELAPFLQDDSWLTRYGVSGSDLKQMGLDILKAGNNCTYLAPTISGLWLPQFKVEDMFEPRNHYVDIFYPYNWSRNKAALVGVLNAAHTVLLAHHNASTIVPAMASNYKMLSRLVGFSLTSWTEHGAVMEVAQREHADLVLVCGGPHGKVLVDKIGQLTDRARVVLDVGSAVENAW